MQVFIEENRVIINVKLGDVDFKKGDDNMVIRTVELIAHDKSYFFPMAMFIGNKDIMCCILHGKEAVNLFKVKQDLKIHLSYNTAGLLLGSKDNNSLMYYIKRKGE